MAGNQNPRFAREALRAMLTDSLPAYLDAVDAEVADGIVLRDLAKIYTAPLQEYDALPAACVIAAGTDYPDEGRSDGIRGHRIELQVYEQSIETVAGMLPAEVVAERVERTMVAIDRMISANETLYVDGTHNADICLVTGVDYSDFQADGAAMFRAARMSLMAWFSL